MALLMSGTTWSYAAMNVENSPNTQGVKQQSDDVETYVVTAQRMNTKDVDTPASTTVLTEKELKKTGANTLFDAISFSTGITNFSYGPGGLDYGAMDSRVNIRGLERGALILVNGAPINLNGKNSMSGLNMSNVEKVEVVKGASSVLYGAEALGGVVNVITKGAVKDGGSASVTVGNLGFKKYDINYTAQKLNIGISKSFTGAIGRTSPNRTDLDGKRGYEYYNDIEKGNQLSLALNGEINDNWSFNYMRSETNSSYGQFSTETKLAKRNLHSSLYHYYDVKDSANFIFDNDKTKAIFFYSDRDLHGENRKLNTNIFKENDSNYVARKMGVDVQHKWNLNQNKDSLITGFLLSRDSYDGTSKANDGVEASRTTYALYSSYTHEFNPSWQATVGARVAHIDDPVKDQNVFIPQVQLLHKLNETSSIYANVGKAFTMPNLSDTFSLQKGKYCAVSGKNLKPEEGWNYELGYKHVTKKDSFKAALFYMHFKNFFDWAPNEADGGRRTLRVNGGEFKNVGIELDYNRQINQRVSFNVGATYSNPRNQKVMDAEWYQTYPRLQFHSGIDYNDGKWNTGLNVNWLTKRLKNRDGGTNPDLINVNAYVGYTFDEDNSLRLNLNNILDRHNVITNGDWEYWDMPFNYQMTYTHKF